MDRFKGKLELVLNVLLIWQIHDLAAFGHNYLTYLPQHLMALEMKHH